MTEIATLKVPKERVEVFRVGLLCELEENGTWLKEQAAEAREALEKVERPTWFRPDELPKDQFDPFGCIGGPLDYVQSAAESLRRLGHGKPTQDVVLSADPATLRFFLEAVAKYCGRVLKTTEFGDSTARNLADTAAWAAQEAQRVEAGTEAQREAVAA